MNKVVEYIAKERMVESTIKKYVNFYNLKLPTDTLDDLAQDLYVSLLSKDEIELWGMVDDGTINYYIYRMVSNNINSTTSPYYKTYRKFLQATENKIPKEKIPYEENERY